MDGFKIEALLNRLKEDRLGCDLKLSFFTSSLLYKFDSCCVPFPPNLIENGTKDIPKITSILSRIPPLTVILKDFYSVAHEAEVLSLLYWLLFEVSGPRIESCPADTYSQLLEIVPQESFNSPPTHIFKVSYKDDSVSEARFATHAQEFGTSFAFHGTKIFNFHNIIHHGLQQHLNKTALFGEGLYLSSELNVSLPYSSTGTGWKKSEIGSKLACVALCEFVEHPVFTKKKTKEGRKGSDIPEKYIVVSSNEMLRVRYLFVYGSGKPKSKSDSLAALLFNHKFLALLYFVVLLLIGLKDSRYVQYLKHNLSRKLSAGVESLRLYLSK